MKRNPIYEKELKIQVRTMKMAWILFGYNIILGIIGLFAFYLTFEKGSTYYSIDYTNILNIYGIIAMIEMCLILFITPGLNAGAISGERERQTLEILLTTKLKPIEIILGKLGASISSIILLVFSSLPILAIIFAVGGIRFIDLFQFLCLAIVTAVFIGSLGIFFSALFQKNITATVFTYGSVVVLIFGTIGMIMGIYLLLAIRTPYAYSDIGVYTGPDVGYLLLILLVNPIITLAAMITGQMGAPNQFAQYLEEYGQISPWIIEHWFLISITMQLLMAIILLYQAGRLLNPFRKKRQRKRTT